MENKKDERKESASLWIKWERGTETRTHLHAGGRGSIITGCYKARETLLDNHSHAHSWSWDCEWTGAASAAVWSWIKLMHRSNGADLWMKPQRGNISLAARDGLDSQTEAASDLQPVETGITSPTFYAFFLSLNVNFCGFIERIASYSDEWTYTGKQRDRSKIKLR